jgi:hypothetical protein
MPAPTENGLFGVAIQLPHVFLPGSSPEENAEVLQALVEMLVAVDRAYLSNARRLGRRLPALYDADVRYVRTDDWLPTPVLYWQKFGDCKSLTAARIAEMRDQGKVAKPVFRFLERPEGTMYHILVQNGVGSFEDPSKVCGMGQDEFSYFRHE